MATTIGRLKRDWEKEYEQWRTRPLGSTEYAYLWADGVYFNVRLEDERSCILVVIGGNYRGEKELLAPCGTDSGRASRAGRSCCWVHRTANILDKLPSSMQGRAKAMIHDIYRAESGASARKAYALFQAAFQDKHPKAVECLRKDEESLFTFYDFRAAHWLHIRSTNVIESIFATVRLRTNKTKGCGTRIATLTMVFRLIQEAQRTWRKRRRRDRSEWVCPHPPGLTVPQAALSRVGIEEEERKRRVLQFHGYRHEVNTFIRGKIPDKQLRRVTGHNTLAMSDNCDHAGADHLTDLKAGIDITY